MNQPTLIATAFVILSITASPVKAQTIGFDLSTLPATEQISSQSGASQGAARESFNTTAGQGQMGYTTQLTGTQGVTKPRPTVTNTQNRNGMKLNVTKTTPMGGIFGIPNLTTGLPATSLDSFVYEAGGSADLIYGDEGTNDIPPYFSFTTEHRINTGITGLRALGLSTGHSSFLPDAWGADEFTGNEWGMSGNGTDIIIPYLGNLSTLTSGSGSTGNSGF